MSRRNARPHKHTTLLTQRRPQVVIAVGVVLILLAAWTMLASSGVPDSVFKQKNKKGGTVSAASLNSNSPSKEYVYAGGRLIATEEPFSGCGSPPSAPGSLTATATASTTVNLTWTAPTTGTADHYSVERKQHLDDSTYAVVIQNVPAAGQNVNVADNNNGVGLSGDTAYIYRVLAFADSSGNCPSAYSNIDLATTTIFSEAVVPGVTTIQALHLTELRTAVNAVRATAGLSAFNWNDPPATEVPTSGGRVLKDQMQKLRNNLNPARTALGLPAQSFTNEPLNIGDSVYAAHIQQLRDGVK